MSDIGETPRGSPLFQSETRMTEFLSELMVDEKTGVIIAEDVRGYWHVLNPNYKPDVKAGRHYLQAFATEKWPNTDEFHDIPDELSGETKLEYTVPVNSYFSVGFVLAAQDGNGGISLIGVYINGSRVAIIPFIDQIHYVASKPLRLPPGTHLEIKFKPTDKSAKLGVFTGGVLLPKELNKKG